MPPNAAATESWKKRSGSASEATRVWVWTSMTPGSTSSPVASTTSSAPAAGPGQVRLDGLDDAAADRDVRSPRARGGDDGPAADDEIGHSTSVIRIAWAPSQRQRRPISRSRSSQPSSGSTDAKWLAASWPTFDAVVQPPYGKKISHSLMPPG